MSNPMRDSYDREREETVTAPPSPAENSAASASAPQADSLIAEYQGPPMLGVVLSFIVLFWGAMGLIAIFWPR